LLLFDCVQIKISKWLWDGKFVKFTFWVRLFVLRETEFVSFLFCGLMQWFLLFALCMNTFKMFEYLLFSVWTGKRSYCDFIWWYWCSFTALFVNKIPTPYFVWFFLDFVLLVQILLGVKELPYFFLEWVSLLKFKSILPWKDW